MCVCLRVCARACARMCMCMCALVFMHMYECACVCVCVRVYECAHVRLHLLHKDETQDYDVNPFFLADYTYLQLLYTSRTLCVSRTLPVS